VTLQNGNHEKMKQLATAPGMGNSLSKSTNKATKTMGKTLLGASKSAKYADWTHEEIDPPVCL
jgi:hypothetical protein